jgi:superfamily I DNA and/or RNA helicase
VLVLAPYNAQVTMVRQRLASAGLGEVRVGTVDKFQGGQAPVVFISMTASSIDEVPRGISFLLNRNRLNVAISRAQYRAVLVRSETLTEYLPATPAGLMDLGAFLSLTAFDGA